MTELLFPGGIARIDEAHVWRELARWMSGAVPGDREVMLSHGHCRLICHTTGREVDGSSKLGVGDAVAQALQTFQGEPEILDARSAADVYSGTE